jgi:hypothetical protein
MFAAVLFTKEDARKRSKYQSSVWLFKLMLKNSIYNCINFNSEESKLWDTYRRDGDADSYNLLIYKSIVGDF